MFEVQKITPFLWFDDGAEAAATHYVKAFPGSRILGVQRYPAGAPRPAGSVMTVSFELAGQGFTGINGGPMFKPTEGMGLAVSCDDQKEVDFLWEHLSEGGSTMACGWLKDRWGFAWQIVPRVFIEVMNGGDEAAKARIFAAMLEMTKYDVAAIARAAKG